MEAIWTKRVTFFLQSADTFPPFNAPCLMPPGGVERDYGPYLLNQVQTVHMQNPLKTCNFIAFLFIFLIIKQQTWHTENDQTEYK